MLDDGACAGVSRASESNHAPVEPWGWEACRICTHRRRTSDLGLAPCGLAGWRYRVVTMRCEIDGRVKFAGMFHALVLQLPSEPGSPARAQGPAARGHQQR